MAFTPGGMPTGPAPMGAPMSVPMKQSGVKAEAKVMIQLAAKCLRAAFMNFDSASQEGKVLLTAIKNLDRIGGDTAGQGIHESELNLIKSQVSSPGGAGGPGSATAPGPQGSPMRPGGPMPLPMGGGT